jgi:SAM-dependent methyltransferase
VEEMLAQIADNSHIVKLQSTMEERPLDKLRESEAPEGFDLVLFKRSLYMNPDEALEILKNSHGHLRPGGCVVVVHPEKKLGPYFFGSPPWFRSYTIPHIINRTSNRFGVLMGVEKYQLYTRRELVELSEKVAGSDKVEVIPSRQHSFNMVAIRQIA